MVDANSRAVKYDGPWFETQLTLSCTLGVLSFFIFSYCRTRWPLLFAPRTKLKGALITLVVWCPLVRRLNRQFTAFSPHEAHAHQAFFGWILPTIRVSEYAVLQIVGLDAAVVRVHHRHEYFHTLTGRCGLSFSTFTKCPSRCSQYAQYLRSQSSCLSTSRCVLVLPLSEQIKGVYVLIFFENSTTSILVTGGTRKTAS